MPPARYCELTTVYRDPARTLVSRPPTWSLRRRSRRVTEQRRLKGSEVALTQGTS